MILENGKFDDKTVVLLLKTFFFEIIEYSSCIF